MDIRKMNVEDYDYIISILNEWWGGRNMADQFPRLFVKHFSDTCLVAEEAGKLTGFLVGFLSQRDNNVAYIHFSGVNPECRRNGVGKQLYDSFYKVASEHERGKINCCTSTVNKLSLAYHTGIGFEVVENNLKVDGVSYFKNYDGKGNHRFLFERENPYLK